MEANREASSLRDSGDNLNQTHTLERLDCLSVRHNTALFAIMTAGLHRPYVCLGPCMYEFTCAFYAVSEWVRGHSAPMSPHIHLLARLHTKTHTNTSFIHRVYEVSMRLKRKIQTLKAHQVSLLTECPEWTELNYLSIYQPIQKLW